MTFAENFAYDQLMALIEPGEGREVPTSEYAALMRRESQVSRILTVSIGVPGILRELDWVSSIAKGAEATRAAHIEFMMRRQEAFAVSDTWLDVVLGASAIDALAQVQNVTPDFMARQLQRLRYADNYAIHVVPTVVVGEHLGNANSRAVLFDPDLTPAVYEEFPCDDNPHVSHERWHAPGSPDAIRLAAAQQLLFREMTGEPT